jgi:hypothetical protein
MGFRLLYNAGNFWTGCETVRLTRKSLLHGDLWRIIALWVLKKKNIKSLTVARIKFLTAGKYIVRFG